MKSLTAKKMTQNKVKTFRHLAGFGKRIEFLVIGKMLKEGLDVFIPLVDDMGIDAIIRKSDGSLIEVQIKARSKDVNIGNESLFAGITHEQARSNYYFVFYSEGLDECIWVMSSAEFIEHSNQNKIGKNKGKRNISFNGMKNKAPYKKDRFSCFENKNFERFK